MNKILKSILIITVIIVGIKLVLSVENLLQLIIDNETIISVTVAIVSGLYLLTGNDKDSEFRPIVLIVFVISVLILFGQFVGSMIEKGMQGLLK